jgi:hypothetical protein
VQGQTVISGQPTPVSGTLTAPRSIIDFCEDEITCPNYCSQNGYCLNGTCRCVAGYKGYDCSVSCSFYYSRSNTSSAITCLTSCPYGTFATFDL